MLTDTSSSCQRKRGHLDASRQSQSIRIQQPRVLALSRITETRPAIHGHPQGHRQWRPDGLRRPRHASRRLLRHAAEELQASTFIPTETHQDSACEVLRQPRARDSGNCSRRRGRCGWRKDQCWQVGVAYPQSQRDRHQTWCCCGALEGDHEFSEVAVAGVLGDERASKPRLVRWVSMP